jgi:hypothetical protein
MSRQKKSKRSLPLRLGKFEIPDKMPWAGWRRNEIHEVEYAGLKFKVHAGNGHLQAGTNLSVDQYGYTQAASLNLVKTVVDMSGDSNSCAYQRVHPYGADREQLIMWAWWLENFPIPRGTVAYLTKNDGDVEGLKRVLNRRGFRTACVTKSKHTGHYPVYLLTHPGDDALREKKNKKNKVVENADVLGNSNADVPQLGNVGDTLAGNRPDTVIQDAPTPVALGEGTESRVRAFYDFGLNLPVGRVEQDAPDGYGNAA